MIPKRDSNVSHGFSGHLALEAASTVTPVAVTPVVSSERIAAPLSHPHFGTQDENSWPSGLKPPETSRLKSMEFSGALFPKPFETAGLIMLERHMFGLGHRNSPRASHRSSPLSGR